MITKGGDSMKLKTILPLLVIFALAIPLKPTNLKADRESYKEHVFDELRKDIDKSPYYSRREKADMKVKLYEKMYGKDDFEIPLIAWLGIILAIIGCKIAIKLGKQK